MHTTLTSFTQAAPHLQFVRHLPAHSKAPHFRLHMLLGNQHCRELALQLRLWVELQEFDSWQTKQQNAQLTLPTALKI